MLTTLPRVCGLWLGRIFPGLGAKQASDIDTQIANMERLIQDDRERMTNEFVAMEAAQAKINQQMTFLLQNFGSSSLLPSTSSSSSSSTGG